MIINTAGEYTLQYTAKDACGNSTTVERELTVEAPPTYRTVLYTDGTFIINESSLDEADNIALHGVATNVYIPFDPNGATNVDKYIFNGQNTRPWISNISNILSVEIGSPIKPPSMSYWFYGCEYVTSFDFTNLDTSIVVGMRETFYQCEALQTIDLSSFDTSNVTDMRGMFNKCSGLKSINLSGFNTSNVTDMYEMFRDCSSLLSLDLSDFNTPSLTVVQNIFWGCSSMASLDVSNFDVTNVSSISNMFRMCSSLTSLDVSSFDTSNITSMGYVFAYCTLIVTIYASAQFVVDQVTSSSNMFTGCNNLVGGAGTPYNVNYVDKARAKIDGGSSNKGYFTAKS